MSNVPTRPLDAAVGALHALLSQRLLPSQITEHPDAYFEFISRLERAANDIRDNLAKSTSAADQEQIRELEVENANLKSRLPSPLTFELTSTEKFLLKWLGDGDGGQFGECEGLALTVLLNLGIAEIGETPAGKHPHYAPVTLTEYGRTLRAALSSGGSNHG